MAFSKMKNTEEVTVICATYNHENYIRDALEGFIMQKTSFPFRVIVHDDASTDKTPEIVLEYAREYPNVIIPILEKENQYCKGAVHFTELMLSYVEGKYIAFCEGDDYWTDPNKLQMQYDALERNKNINFCACGTYVVDAETLKVDKKASIIPFTSDCVISVRDTISRGGGFVGTPASMYRKSIFDKWPAFFRYYPHDYSFQIYGALGGGVYYLSAVMACARKPHSGSITHRINTDWEKGRIHHNKIITMLRLLDKETQHMYRKEIRHRVLKMQYLDGIFFIINRIKFKRN